MSAGVPIGYSKKRGVTVSDVQPVKIVNRVIDSLDVRIFRHAQPSQRLMRDAAVWRELIAAFEPGDSPQFVQLPGLGTFRIKMGGKAPYEFVLMNPQICDIRIWNVGRWHSLAASQTGQLYVSFRSVFLQLHGLEAARACLEALTGLFCTRPDPDTLPADAEQWKRRQVHPEAGPEFDRVARVDLAVDTQEHREMVWGDLDRFVCRARKLDTWAHLTPANIEDVLKLDLSAGSFLPMDRPDQLDALPQLARSAARVLHGYVHSLAADLETYGEADLSRVVSHNRKPQTVYFGRFGSQLYARRYNKLGSLVVQNKLFMLDVWHAGGWDQESPVLRTEFSISGDFLKTFSIHQDGGMIQDCRDLHLLDHLVPVLWDYLTVDWLSMRDVQQDDSNYRRWPVSADWSILPGAFGDTDLTCQRDHGRTVPREDTHLVLQSRGCSVSTVALRAAKYGDYDQALQSMADDYLTRLTQHEFRADVDLRLLEFGLDSYTDTELSATIRRERMAEAVGS